MRLILRLQSLNFRNGRRATNPEVLGALARALGQGELAGALRFLVKPDGAAERLESLARLAEESGGLKDAAYRLASDEQKSPEVAVHVARGAGDATVIVGCRDDYVERNAAGLVGELLDLVKRLHDALGPDVVLGPVANLEIVGAGYPRPRPPRSHLHFPPGTAATILCREYHASEAGGDPEDVKRLLEAKPPAGATREEHGRLVIFRWVEDLRDEEKVRRARQAQEAWLSRVLAPPVESGFNAEGDQQVAPISPEPHPPLTLYDSFAQEGFKALVLRPGEEPDADVMKDVRRWSADRALPDGTPVQRLNLVLPSRRAALEIRDRAVAAGADGVYYAGDEGTFWNPFPPGEWAE